MDVMPYSLGWDGSVNFRAYGNYFFLGGSLGLSGYELSEPTKEEIYSKMPMSVCFGYSRPFGEDLESKRFGVGVSLGLNSASLRVSDSISNGREYSDSKFYFGFFGTMNFHLLSGVYVGPVILYQSSSNLFRDRYGTGGNFMREFNSSSLTFGIDISYYWGLFL